MSLVRKSSPGSSKLEGPQEVVSFLEVGTNSVDLVDEVFNIIDAVFSKGLSYDGVG